MGGRNRTIDGNSKSSGESTGCTSKRNVIRLIVASFTAATLWQLEGQMSKHPTVTTHKIVASMTDSSVFDNVFLIEGRDDKWTKWSGRSALTHDDAPCEWATFKPHGNPENIARMCTYPANLDRFVSRKIQNKGRWNDCDELVGLWKESVEQLFSSTIGTTTKTMLYLELGGNIGSCMMEMLQSTDANIVVFEPHPLNLSQMTTTLMAQPESVRKRVALFPIGVGDVTGSFDLHMASNNRGNSVLEIQIKDAPSQQFIAPAKVYVERLDDIFNANNVVVPLVKMDIQGYECKALSAARHLVNTSVYTVTAEADRMWKTGHGCSQEALREQLANFDVRGGYQVVARKKKE